jgi:hypothetical protein
VAGVVDIDMEAYPGGQALAEAGEVDPGMFVTVNDNDSDGDGTVDLNDEDVPSDPDIVKLKLSMTPAGGVSGQEEVSLAWTTEDNHVEVYGEDEGGGPDKEDALSSGVEFPVGDLPCNVYVEGLSATDGLRDLVFVADTTCAGLQMEDRIRATVIDVDLSVSDLDGSVAEQDEEDPGAFVHENIDNDNANTDGGEPVADQEEQASVTGEDDLKGAAFSLAPAGLAAGTVVLRRNNAKTRVWSESTKGAGNKVLVDGDQISWDLSDAGERSEFAAVKESLWVEGYDNNGTSTLTAEYEDPRGAKVWEDAVQYTYVAALCGRQPAPGERTWFSETYENLVHCEWSITGEATPAYNCIAWSAGITDRWIQNTVEVDGIYYEEYVLPDRHLVSIDKKYGDGDNVFEMSDLDAFYSQEAGLDASATGPSDAEVMYYDGFHAARRKGCGCGAGRWMMFESKLGQAPRIEHVHDQLDSCGYGERSRYYK